MGSLSLSLSLSLSELTGVGEGGGGKAGGGGGADYVVSSKWAKDPDINLKIRSGHHTPHNVLRCISFSIETAHIYSRTGICMYVSFLEITVAYVW